MEVTEEGYMIEGTWLEVVAADALLEVSVVAFEGNRACRGRNALGGGTCSRDGVEGRVLDGVADLSGSAVGGGLEKSGESARAGLRARRGLDVDRGPGVEGW